MQAVAVLVGCATVVALGWASSRVARSLRRRGPARGQVPRRAVATAALGVAVLLMLRVDGDRIVIRAIDLIAVAVLAALAWKTPTPAGLALRGLTAAHLPGQPTGRTPTGRVEVGWVGVLLCAGLWALLAAAVLAPDGWVAPALGVLAVAATATAVALLQRSVRHGRQVRDALARYAPSYVLPYNGRAVFHLDLWQPYLDRTGRRTVVVTTDPATFARVAAGREQPVVYSPSTSRAAVRALLPPSVTTAFYVHHRRTSPFLRFRRIRHVFVHHGDSDKVSGARMKAARYDDLVVPGQAAIDRYQARGARIPLDRFQVLGRPPTEAIELAAGPIARIECPRVLYAPTWHGVREDDNYSSLLSGESIVRALLARGAVVIFRPHPSGRSRPEYAAAISGIKSLLKADAKETGRAHVWGMAAEKVPFAEVANASDAMISDVSGVVIDYLHSLKPYAMVAVLHPVPEFRERNPTAVGAYVIAGDLANLDEVLDQLLGADPLRELRRERRDYFLGGFEGDGAAAAFVAYAEALAAGADRRPRSVGRAS